MKTRVIASDGLIDFLKEQIKHKNGSIILEEESVLSVSYDDEVTIVLRSAEKNSVIFPSGVLCRKPKKAGSGVVLEKETKIVSIPYGFEADENDKQKKNTIYLFINEEQFRMVGLDIEELIFRLTDILLGVEESVDYSSEEQRQLWEDSFHFDNFFYGEAIALVKDSEKIVWRRKKNEENSVMHFLLLKKHINKLFWLESNQAANSESLQDILDILSESAGDLSEIAFRILESNEFEFIGIDDSSSRKILCFDDFFGTQFNMTVQNAEVPLFGIESVKSAPTNFWLIERMNQWIREGKLPKNFKLQVDDQRFSFYLSEILVKFTYERDWTKFMSPSYIEALMSMIFAIENGTLKPEDMKNYWEKNRRILFDEAEQRIRTNITFYGGGGRKAYARKRDY